MIFLSLLEILKIMQVIKKLLVETINLTETLTCRYGEPENAHINKKNAG